MSILPNVYKFPGEVNTKVIDFIFSISALDTLHRSGYEPSIAYQLFMPKDRKEHGRTSQHTKILVTIGGRSTIWSPLIFLLTGQNKFSYVHSCLSDEL